MLLYDVKLDDCEVAGYAYRLWEAAGCPDDRSDEFWFRACDSLRFRHWASRRLWLDDVVGDAHDVCGDVDGFTGVAGYLVSVFDRVGGGPFSVVRGDRGWCVSGCGFSCALLFSPVYDCFVFKYWGGRFFTVEGFLFLGELGDDGLVCGTVGEFLEGVRRSDACVGFPRISWQLDGGVL